MSRNVIQAVCRKAMAILLVGGTLFAVPTNGCSGTIDGIPFSIGPGLDNGIDTTTPSVSSYTPVVDDTYSYYPYNNTGYRYYAFAYAVTW